MTNLNGGTLFNAEFGIRHRAAPYRKGQVLHSVFAAALFIENPKANKSSLVKKIIEKRVTSCIEYTDPKLIEAAKIIDEAFGTGKAFNIIINVTTVLEKIDSNGVAKFGNGKEYNFKNTLDALNERLMQAEQLMDRVNSLLDGVSPQGRVIYNKEKDSNSGDV